MKRFIKIAVLAIGLAPLAGCIIAPYGSEPHYHQHWVGGSYGNNGGWHHGHWN